MLRCSLSFWFHRPINFIPLFASYTGCRSIYHTERYIITLYELVSNVGREMSHDGYKSKMLHRILYQILFAISARKSQENKHCYFIEEGVKEKQFLCQYKTFKAKLYTSKAQMIF